MFSDMKITSNRESGREGNFKLTKRENRLTYLVFLFMIISYIYAFFLPLQPEITWLSSGLIIYLFGAVFTIITIKKFVTTPKDRVITKGPYRFTRNPMYVGLIMLQLGIGIACSSWLYLLLTVVLMILLNANTSGEERYCHHLYGDDFQKYKNSTPRWIGIPKSKEPK